MINFTSMTRRSIESELDGNCLQTLPSEVTYLVRKIKRVFSLIIKLNSGAVF